MMPPPSSHTFLTNRKFLLGLCLIFCGFLSAQPVANFTASPQSGCSPLTVNFQDISTGSPTSWEWDLGNGTLSNIQNPSTIYLNPGTYTVTLTSTNANGSGTVTKTNYITVYDKPNPNFSVSSTNGCAPFTTTFTDLSTTPAGTTITAWEWDFGDGKTSTDKNPAHTYTAGGLFDITLKLTNSGGCANEISRSQYITVSPTLVADFNFTNSVKCKPPENIFFTNTTTGTGTITYTWDYGDGSPVVTGKSPSHVFTAPGPFIIHLTAVNQLGCKSEDSSTIKLGSSIPVIAGPDSICVNSTASFTNASAPAPIKSQWSFGDNTFSAQTSPTKSWAAAGTYNLKLVNTYTSCVDSATKTITVVNLPVVKFTADDTASCRVPFTVNFTDVTPGSISWSWDFGDSSAPATTQTPSHTYTSLTSNGRRNVTLTTANSYGCTITTTVNDYIKIFEPTVTINTVEGGGCLPYIFKPTAEVSSADGVASYLWSFPNGDPVSSTSATPSITYNTLGTFDVNLTITTNDGCQATAVATEGVKTGTKPTVDFTVSPLTGLCAGSTFNFTDASAPADRWQWSFGDGSSSTQQNASHAYNDTGSFSVKLMAWNNGCNDSITKSKIVTVFPAVARFTPTYNCANKKEVAFTNTSILAQTWAWDFGDGSTSTLPNPIHVFSGLQDYTVSLTVTNGSCSHTTTQLIKTIDEQPDFTLLKDSVCKLRNASFTAINIDPANIQSYIWDFGDGQSDTTTTDTVSHAYSTAGAFTVKLSIIDIRDCIKSITKPNIVQIFSPKAAFTTSVTAGCTTSIITFTDATTTANGNNNIATWKWNFADSQTATINAPSSPNTTHTYANEGNYVPSLLVTDSAGCQDSVFASASIFISKPKAIFNTLTPKTCNNDSVLFNNFSTGTNLTYQWDFGDSTYATDVRPIKLYNTNGSYNVKLTVTDINGCQSSYTYVNYIEVKEVFAAFSLSDSFGTCIPFKVTLTNNSVNQTSNLWSYGDGFATANPNPTLTHSYNSSDTFLVRLTAMRGKHCTSIATKNIIVDAPKASISYTPLNGCAPLPVNFTIVTKNQLTFQWDFNDGSTYSTTDTFASHTYLFPGKNGKYIPLLLIKDNKNCIIPIFGIDTIRIYSSSVNFGVDKKLVCDSGIVQFTDSTISGSAVVGYSWDFGDGFTSSQQNPSHRYSGLGQYTVRLAITTIYGCHDTLVKTNFITVAKKPNIAIDGIKEYCGPSSVILKGVIIDADTSSLSWNWNFGNGNTSQLQNPPSQQYNDTINYPVQLIAIASSGCGDTATNNIIIHPVPAVSAGADTTICLGAIAQLQASGADTYTWQPSSYLSCINCSNPVANPTDSITYTVTGSTVFGCINFDAVFIDVKKPFTLTGLKSEDSVCLGKSIQLTVNGAEIYNWSPSAGLNNTTSASVQASPAVGTIYKVIGSDSKNCFTDSAFINLQVKANPTVNAGADKLLHLGNSIPLSITYSTDVVSWLWSPATGLSCSNCPAPIASPETSTTYSITVTNGSKCTATDNVFIKVVCDNSNLFIPTAFTPNNDGLNDVFYPMGVGLFKIQSLRIFNRYGQVVFLKDNFNANDKSAGWDGSYKGKISDPGAYIYTLEVICKNSEVLTINGKILLIQ